MAIPAVLSAAYEDGGTRDDGSLSTFAEIRDDARARVDSIAWPSVDAAATAFNNLLRQDGYLSDGSVIGDQEFGRPQPILPPVIDPNSVTARELAAVTFVNVAPPVIASAVTADDHTIVPAIPGQPLVNLAPSAATTTTDGEGWTFGKITFWLAVAGVSLLAARSLTKRS